MNVRTAARSCALLATALFTGLAAHGQLFQAYVSAGGSDSNACSLAAPCRFLPAALAAVADGGEIWMLDSASYNTGTVDTSGKSVSILAVPGAIGSVVGTGSAPAITVSGVGSTVSLRNLVIVGFGAGTIGVTFTGGAMLNINDCRISGMSDAGVSATAANGVINIRDTIVRDSNENISIGNQVEATIDHVQITGGAFGVVGNGGSRVTIVNGDISGTSEGVVAYSSGGLPARVSVERTVITHVAKGIHSLAASAGDNAFVVARGNTIVQASGAAMVVDQPDSSTGILVADGNLITGANTVFLFAHGGGGTIYSRGNNSIPDNGAYVSGGTLTPTLGNI